MLLAQVEIEHRRVDVRVCGDRVREVAERLRPLPDEDVVDAGGAALLPGLHDHHIHLLAAAAARSSVECGPPAVTDVHGLRAALQAAPGQDWLRGVGYTESVAGPLDRHLLDRLVADRPVRVQHRGGALWGLNTTALRTTGLDRSTDPDVERDDGGEATGRLWRFDTRLRDYIGADDVTADLMGLVEQLARYGVTGVTDATPDLDAAAILALSRAPVDLLLLGAPYDAELPGHVAAGPRKLLLRDHDLPDLDALVQLVEHAHTRGRSVAVHCVTRESLILTVLALEQAGARDGDRIEHASVVPREILDRLAALRVAVVTQPSFVARRGDDYLRDVAPDDLNCLYPYSSLLGAGVSVAPSSDAPYGDLDPWRTMIAARDRTTPAGVHIAEHERVGAATALRGFLSALLDPGGEPRRIALGGVADLCLLDAPLDDVLADPDAARVRLVLRRGEVVHRRGETR
jgi:predicted amidohydrolase YtcJ